MTATRLQTIDYIRLRVQAELVQVQSYYADARTEQDYVTEFHLAGLTRAYQRVLAIVSDAELSVNVVQKAGL